jgi:heptosyltransferase II
MGSKSQKRTLIVKLGYSETFVSHVRTTCSLGDVLRTTSILHLFVQDNVTWLTDAAAVPLLAGNPLIDRIVAYTPETARRLESEQFDTIVNLEKVPELCAMVDRMAPTQHYGFRIDNATGNPTASDDAYDALIVATHDEAKRTNNRSWAELLFAMLGATWRGEGYVLGYKPGNAVARDVGFNTHVGSLFPVKAWPAENWTALDGLLADRYSRSYQQCLDNLEGYIDWINSCRLIVTSDSLGLHLGLALGKKVVALFGPTPASDLDPNDNLKVLVAPADRDCLPCCRAECTYDETCMQFITPESVFAAVEELMREQPAD